MDIKVPPIDNTNWPPYLINDSALYIVGQRFNFAQEYADKSFHDAREALEDLKAALTGFTMPETDIDYSFVPSSVLDAMAILAGYRPERPADLTIADVPRPDEPDLIEVDEIEPGEMPDFVTEAYIPVFPEAPDSPMPPDPGDAPAIMTPERIPAPDVSFPEPPILEDLVIPGAPDLPDRPSFNGEKPTISVSPPDPLFVYNEPVSDRDLAEAVKARLLADIAAGGTGLGAEAENAIWERAKERERLEYVAERDRIIEQNAGFDLPPGAMAARLDELSKRRQRSLAQSNHEIMIEQARLAQAHLHFAIEQASGLQRILNDQSNTVAQRTFEAARYTVEHAIKVHEAAVRAFNAKLEEYKAEASVYTEIVRAMTLYLEQYKARLEGVRLAADVQNQQVTLYNARLDAIKTMVGVYSERVTAQATEMEAEKVKLQAFATAVEVFAKKIEARTAEYNLWQARVAGEGEKVRVYGQQVEAYGKRLEAIKTGADIQKVRIDSQIQRNRDQIEIYRVRIEEYRANLQKAIEQIKALVQAYGMDTEVYRSDGQVLKGQQDAETELLKARMQQSRNQSDIALKEAELTIQSALQEHAVWIESIKALINASSQIAASALSAVNASASLGLSTNQGTQFQYSRGESIGWQAEKRESYQESRQTQT